MILSLSIALNDDAIATHGEAEVVSILRRAAVQVRDTGLSTISERSVVLRDTNGNRVGHMQISGAD